MVSDPPPTLAVCRPSPPPSTPPSRPSGVPNGPARPGWRRRSSRPSIPAILPGPSGDGPGSCWPISSLPCSTRARPGAPVVVATATLALQGQIIDRDLPRLAEALTPLLGRRPRYALVKGRAQPRVQAQTGRRVPARGRCLVFELADVSATASRLGATWSGWRMWAADTDSGDRDELVPGVSSAPGVRSVSPPRSVSATGAPCRESASSSGRGDRQGLDVVVTNHAFMAIDAFEGRFMLPEHDVLIIDEAHELVDRITSTITDELTPGRRSERRPARPGKARKPTASTTARWRWRRHWSGCRRAGSTAYRSNSRSPSRR